MSKVIELLSKYLFIPLILKGVEWVKKYFSNKKEEKERHAQNTGKAEDFKNASTPQSAADSFDSLN